MTTALSQTRIDKIQKLFQNVADSLTELAGEICSLTEEEFEELQSEMPQVGVDTWNMLLRVGDGSLHPKLAMAPGTRVVKRLTASPLPVQRNAVEKGIRVRLAPGESPTGDWDTMVYNYEDMPARFLDRVFDNKGEVRNPDQQQRWMRNSARRKTELDKPTVERKKLGYRVLRSRVYFDEPKDKGYTAKELLRAVLDSGMDKQAVMKVLGEV